MYEKFAELLAKTNKTAYQVAKDTGIGENTFSHWKTGRSKPKLEKLVVLLRTLKQRIQCHFFLTDPLG